MILLIGGACQGKMQYAKKLTGISNWCDGSVCTREELLAASGIFHFEQFVKRELEKGLEVTGLAEELSCNNEDCVVISGEIGYGLVPMEAFDRKYREEMGRICTQLAHRAKEVHRIVCGIGMVIKHD